MKNIKEKRLEILLWERDNRNLYNRAIDHLGGCVYSHRFNGGRAVGRLLSEGLAEELSEKGGVQNIFSELPPEIQELDESFLHKLQELHDFPLNWNESGLSEAGLLEWEKIKKNTVDII